MRTWVFVLLAVTSGFTYWSCTNSNLQIQEKKWEEIMVAHDEVMPQMATIEEISGKIRAAYDSTHPAAFNKILQELTTAGDGMMTWMNELKPLNVLQKEGMDHNGIMVYLEGEKQKIEAVKNQMLSSISSGKTMLDSLGNK